MLESAAFKKNVDFLAFTRRITTYYLKAVKMRKHIPHNIVYLCKRSWKGDAVVAVYERRQGQHFAKKCTQK